MESSTNSLSQSGTIIIQDIFAYFKKSQISTVFFIFIILIIIFNLFRKYIIQIEREQETLIRRCKYLDTDNDKQCCTSQSYEDFFAQNNDSCKGCPGRSVLISDSEIEELIGKKSVWKYIIIWLANTCRGTLPYVAFFYTLALAIFEKNI